MLCMRVWLHDTLKQRDILVEAKHLRVERSHRILPCLINKSPSIRAFPEPQGKFKSQGGGHSVMHHGYLWNIKH